MELRELRYFVALVEERTFTKAAARCFVTQPAFSRAIRKLEKEAAGDLVLRGTRQIVLTERGGHLLETAYSLIGLADTGLAKTKAAASAEEHPIRIGIGMGARAGLGSRVRHLVEVETGVTVGIRGVDYYNQTQLLACGQLDAVLGILPPGQPGLECVVLCTEPKVAILSDIDPASEASHLSVADVVDHPLYPADEGEPSGWDAIWTLRDERGEDGRRLSVPYVLGLDQFVDIRQHFGMAATTQATSQWLPLSILGLKAVPLVDAIPVPVTLTFGSRPAPDLREVLGRCARKAYADVTGPTGSLLSVP